MNKQMNLFGEPLLRCPVDASIQRVDAGLDGLLNRTGDRNEAAEISGLQASLCVIADEAVLRQ
jgi:hypothetical protein